MVDICAPILCFKTDVCQGGLRRHSSRRQLRAGGLQGYLAYEITTP